MDRPKASAILSIQSISVFLGKKSQLSANPGMNRTKIELRMILRVSIVVFYPV